MPKTVEELEQVIADLQKQIKKATASADDDDPGPGRSIPAEAFSRHRRQLRELRETVESVQQQLGKTVTEVKSGYDKALKKATEQHEADLANSGRTASVDLELSDLGIKDPTIRRLTREHYSTLDEKIRPESAAEWVKARRAAAEKAKADEKAEGPSPIAWLDAYEAHTAGQTKQPARQRKAPPNLDGGAGPAGSEGFSAEDVASMSPAALAKAAGLPVPADA